MRSDPVIRRLCNYERFSIHEINAVRQLCNDVRIFNKHRDFHNFGASSEYTYVVLNGWAARYFILPDGERRIIAFLLPGDFCDLNFATTMPLDHGIVSITECATALFSKSAAEHVMNSFVALKQAWGKSLRTQEACQHQWLVSAGRRSARAAVAHLFCELYVRMHQVGLAHDGDLPMPASQIDLADAIGITAIHLNRTLRNMRDDGLIERTQGVRIPDLGALRQVAGFDPRHLGLDDVGMFFPNLGTRATS